MADTYNRHKCVEIHRSFVLFFSDDGECAILCSDDLFLVTECAAVDP